MSHTLESLTQQLRSAGIDAQRPLLVHSSMKAIGIVEGGPQTVLDAFFQIMHIGEIGQGLLIFPSHSWKDSSNPNGIFVLEKEPSCVGLLSELFRKRAQVKRSKHPTHSVCAIGTGLEDYIALDDNANSPCPADGCWGMLGSMHTQIAFIGCPLSSNTFIHSLEEKVAVEQRLGDAIEICIEAAGQSKTVTMLRHKAPVKDVSQHYVKLAPALFKHGALQQFEFGDASCYLLDAAKTQTICLKLLSRDRDLFGDSAPIPEAWY